MLPTSSSQLSRYGQINHYKKFWLLQTQLEKQEQSSTSLSLGVTGNANIVKESKPLVSSNALITNGDHMINNNNIAGHGSCRADMALSASACSSRGGGGAFPYCSNEPGSLKFYTSSLGYNSHIHNGSLRDSSALSLAVNCERVAHPTNFFNPTWSPSPLTPVSELQLLNLPNAPPVAHPCIHEQVKEIAGITTAEECESSECSNGGGEKRGLLWDNTSTSPSTSNISLSSKLHPHELNAAPQCNPPSSTLPSSLHESPVSPPPLRNGHAGSAPLRTCSLCGTSKTPLWRSGPDGPKSLCNACGIRVKKTKRLQAAMEAAGEGAEGIISSASSPASAYKRLLAVTTKAAGGKSLKRKLSMEAAENQSDPMFNLRKKKKKAAGLRRSWPPPNVAAVDSGTCYRVFGDAAANLAAGLAVVDNSMRNKSFSSSSSSSSNLFAQDVEEAAVLLMALSCGLVLS